MSFTQCDVVFCSLDGKPVKTMEGYSVNVDMPLADVEKDQIRSFVLPGGGISAVDTEEVWTFLKEQRQKGTLIAGICAGVDVLDHAGILKDISSTHSTDLDIVNDSHVITARANAYVDFAIETAKELGLFSSQEDLEETIDFWKYYHRVQ